MQKINFNYSLKNIPIPSKTSYRLKLIEEIESVIKRMRWKAFFHLKENGKNEMETENFGFKSKNCPLQCKELKNFEKDLYNIITCIKYRKSEDCFQTKMKEDISKIKASPNVLVFANKTTNIYQVSPSKYNKLLNDNITKTYKKSTDRLEKSINMEAKDELFGLTSHIVKMLPQK